MDAKEIILKDYIEGEKWQKIKGWEDYSISDHARIYSHRRNKLLKIWEGAGKYPRIMLCNNGYDKTLTVHRLVATAFIDNPLNKLTVNHKDGNKSNNHVSNLEWCTISENMVHAVKNGLAKPPYYGEGEKHQAAKLTNVDIEMIRVLSKHDFTLDQISKRFNVHAAHISAIILNKTWKHLLPERN